jgi:4-hydroxybenzoate polyprenyltransferase
MTPKTLLELGRVSNLPTVVSNVACGAALAGGGSHALALELSTLAGCLFYVGGMVLNDAFDAEVDARERPERPIPSGRASRKAVFRLGFSLLVAGLALLGVAVQSAPGGPLLALAGTVTAVAVVVYDRFHKGVALAPVVMGLCRAGLYVMGALSVTAEPPLRVWVGAGVLVSYVVGLTHIARFEATSSVGKLWLSALLFLPLGLAVGLEPSAVLLLPAALFAAWTVRGIALARRGGPNIGRAVVTLIAGISLIDTLLATAVGDITLALVAIVAWAATLGLQRVVRGT